MNKKLVAALLAGGLILGFPAAPKAAGNVSVPGSLHEVEKRGVQKVGTKYYYFDPKTGVRKKGLLSVSGKMYYFTSRWYAVKGFHRVNGRLLFTNERGLVCRPSGLVVQAGRRYYFDPKTGKKIINLCKANRDLTLQTMRENGEITGRPDKQAIVRQWQTEHPHGRKADCIRDTGLTKPTVYKWWSEPKRA